MRRGVQSHTLKAFSEIASCWMEPDVWWNIVIGSLLVRSGSSYLRSPMLDVYFRDRS